MKKFLCFLFLFIPLNVLALSSKSSIVMDMDSKRVLYEDNSHEKRLIASTTKIMTAIIAIEKGNLSHEVKVGDEVLKMYGTSIYLEVNEKMKLIDLLYGLMLRSGNDASVVIAKEIAGSEKKFVELMNKKAKEIGMKDTVFNNPHGLDEVTKNYSTAYDMALLSSYAYKNKVYRKIINTYKYRAKTLNKSYLWYNRNKLLKNYSYCTGGKNGYTPKAGKTLVTTHEKDNLKITVVTLYDNDEYNNHKYLANKTFSLYRNYDLVLKYSFNTDNYYIKKDFYYPLTIDEKDNVKVLAKVDNKLKKGEVGNIEVSLGNKTLTTIPIYFQKKKEKSTSFFKRLFS